MLNRLSETLCDALDQTRNANQHIAVHSTHFRPNRPPIVRCFYRLHAIFLPTQKWYVMIYLIVTYYFACAQHVPSRTLKHRASTNRRSKWNFYATILLLAHALSLSPSYLLYIMIFILAQNCLQFRNHVSGAHVVNWCPYTPQRFGEQQTRKIIILSMHPNLSNALGRRPITTVNACDLWIIWIWA